MEQTSPLSDQLANISPILIVGVVVFLTCLRIVLAKNKDTWARTISETCDTVSFVLILAFLLIRPFVAQAFYIPSESMESTLLVHDRLVVNKFAYRLTNPQHHDVVVFEAPPAATGKSDDESIDFIKRLIGLPGDTIQVKAPKLSIDGQPFDARQTGMGSYDQSGANSQIHPYLHTRLGLADDDSVKIFSDYVLINGKDKLTKEQLAEKLGQPGAKIEMTPGQTLVNGEVQNEPFTREDPDYDFPVSGPALKLEPDHFFMMGDNRNHSADSHIWGPLEKRRVVGKASVIFWPPSRAGLIR